MILDRPSTPLKGRIQYDPFHVLHVYIPAFPDQTEAPKSNTNTKWFFCAPTHLQECQHLTGTVSMGLSVLPTSIKIQRINIQKNTTPRSHA